MSSRLFFAGILSFVLVMVPWIASANGDGIHEVGIRKFKFIPQEISIQVGETVRWINREKRQYHSVWFEKLGEEESPYLFPDESVERTFHKPGDYPYRCGPHEEMTGVVHVR